MENAAYEQMILRYTRELSPEALQKVLHLLAVLYDKEQIHRRLDLLNKSFERLAGHEISKA
ncbi:MAG: hypothetical protein V4543_15310 [Bacteroidota bacterium]